MSSLKVFSGNSNPNFIEGICRYLQQPIGVANITRFPDGEVSVKLDEDVRNSDVFIIQSTNPPAENLIELLIMIDAAKRASARRITAVIPYFSYARQDRKDVGRVSIAARLMANLLESAGADRVLSMDFHTNQLQGFFGIPVDHLYGESVLVPALRELTDDGMVILSPDAGSIKRAVRYGKHLGLEVAWTYKERNVVDNTVKSIKLLGDVKDRDILIVDDMIDTGSTMVEAIQIAREHGAGEVIVAATHGVFSADACDVLRAEACEIITTNSHCNSVKVDTIVDASPLFAQAIDRIHRNKSISDLFL